MLFLGRFLHILTKNIIMNTVKKALKDSPLMRWFVLLLISGLTFSTYWFQDFFSGIKPLMISEMGITSSQFGTLIQWTTWANIFGMIIVGGIILDKWGIRLAGIAFGGLATLGAALTALGAAGTFTTDTESQLWIMMIGRLLFGSGLEVVCVIAMRTIVKWFKGYELALAMALNMGFGRLGSTLGTALSADIANGTVPPAVNFAATLIALGLLMFLIYIIFDIKLDRQLKSDVVEEEEPFRFSDLIKLITNRSFLFIALLCVTFYSAVFPFMQYAPDLLINKYGFTYELPAADTFGSTMAGNVFIYIGLFIFALAITLWPSYIKEKGKKILATSIILALFVLFIYTFRDTLALWLNNGPKTASLIPLGSILFTPIFGNFVDKKGKAGTLMIFGSILLIFAHISLSVLDNVFMGYLGLVSLGVAFSLVPAAMWPSVAKIVAENRLGTAYATMFTIQNIGLNLFFKGIGWVLDKVNPDVVAQIEATREQLKAQGLSSGEISEKLQHMQQVTHEIPPFDYTTPILMLVGLGVLAMFLAFMLKRADIKQGYGLERPSNS